MNYTTQYYPVLCHHGILKMKWGVRRYQNRDGTLTAEGKKRLREKRASAKEKKASEMTDEELRSKTSRMQLENNYNNALKTYKENETRSKGPSKAAVAKDILARLDTALKAAKKDELDRAKQEELKKALKAFSEKPTEERKAERDRLIMENLFLKNYAAVRDSRGFEAGENRVLKILGIAGGIVTTGLSALEIAELIAKKK